MDRNKLFAYILGIVMISLLLLMQFGGLIMAVVLVVKGYWLFSILSLFASIIGYVTLHILRDIDSLKEVNEDDEDHP